MKEYIEWTNNTTRGKLFESTHVNTSNKVWVVRRRDGPNPELMSLKEKVDEKEVQKCQVKINQFGSVSEAADFMSKIAKEYVDGVINEDDLFKRRDELLALRMIS